MTYVWQWIVKWDDDGSHSLSENFFATKEEAQSVFPRATVIDRYEPSKKVERIRNECDKRD